MLLDLHKKFVSSPTETKRKEVEERIISKLEEGRRQLGLDVILRGPAGNDSATLSNVGVIPLYNLVFFFSKLDDTNLEDGMECSIKKWPIRIGRKREDFEIPFHRLRL